jgi:tetratricopeptide (TPR) repeat protein
MAWRTMGLRLARDGDRMAEFPLREAYALNPSDAEVTTGLGELLMSKGELAEAFQLFRSAVGQHPDFLVARMALGRLYERRGSYQNAIEHFEAVVQRDKEFVDAWFELGICYLQTQQAAKAQHAIDEALKRYPNEPHYLALKGSVDAAVGNVRNGINMALKASDLAPEDLKINVNLITMLLVNHETPEDLDTAERVIARVEKLEPNLPVTFYHRGELARLRGQYNDAIPYLEQAIKRSPNLLEGYFSLSQVYRKVGRTADATKTATAYRVRQAAHRKIEDMRIVVAADPDNVDKLLGLADLQAKNGDVGIAIETLRSAAMIDPNNPEVRKRAEVLQKQRQPNAASGAAAP